MGDLDGEPKEFEGNGLTRPTSIGSPNTSNSDDSRAIHIIRAPANGLIAGPKIAYHQRFIRAQDEEIWCCSEDESIKNSESKASQNNRSIIQNVGAQDKEGWLDPEVLSQLIGALAASSIAIALWFFEGGRIRKQLETERRARELSTKRILRFELASFHRGISKLNLFLDELSVNADMEEELDIPDLARIFDKKRLDRITDYWLDANRVRARLDPVFIDEKTIDDVEKIVSREDDLETEIETLFEDVMAAIPVDDRIPELMREADDLAEEIKQVIASLAQQK